jgi:hypothetical protein
MGLPSSVRARLALAGALATAAFTALAQVAYANVALTQVSSDPFTNSGAQHMTQVEPDTYVQGNTIVSAFQVGRVSTGGASDVGWATSTDRGATWTHGFLSGITVNQGGGQFQSASDAAVAFDARHNAWLISTLGVNGPGGNLAVFTSRSTDGGHTWSGPVTVATGQLDKNWIVCDDTASSPFFGHCYTEYDVTSSGNLVRMQTSTDGGLTWGPARSTGDSAHGLGGQPVVRPNGTVIVPFESSSGSIRSFRSIDGGTSWRSTVLVSNTSHHTTAGGLRSGGILPSAEIDGAGTVYVAWSDSRFRPGGAENDIVLAKSTSETTWAAPTRVPIDPTTSTVDHFVPGLGVDRSTSGSTARIGLTYYFYPVSSCSASTCQLDVGYISSTNGGSSWSGATQLAGPMSLSWLPNTTQGRMFGDYISTSVLAGGPAFPVISVATAPTGGTFHQSMFVPTGGLAVRGGANHAAAAGAAPVAEGAAAAAATAR